MKNIGFIGMGNMAQAIADGLMSRGLLKKEQVFAYAPNTEKLEGNAERIGFTPCNSAEDVCKKSDYVIMACKPQQALENAEKLKKELKDKALLSIAWGLDFAAYSKILSKDTRIQFIMPNTPAQVGEGVYLFEEENSLLSEELTEI
ncbi:MAG: NAD(P)-binding domain-containing protein, partial [Christensenellaceae bacterium]|nr:NAD(P)-binding domain-containing protein [Christensenellaceae bacterium]